MSKPIKETPILRGQDAVSFLAAAKLAETKKATKAELDRIKENFNKFKSIATFAL